MSAVGNPTNDSTSFNSQPTFIVEYTPASGKPYHVYMGDDWEHCPNADGSSGPLVNACYVWLPIRLQENGTAAGPKGLPVEIDDSWRWSLDDPFAPPPPRPPQPAPPPPSPPQPPQPTPHGWTEHANSYCSDHHGSRLFGVNVPSLAQCAARCSGAPGCACFDYQLSSGGCRGVSGTVDLKSSSHGVNAYTKGKGPVPLKLDEAATPNVVWSGSPVPLAGVRTARVFTGSKDEGYADGAVVIWFHGRYYVAWSGYKGVGQSDYDEIVYHSSASSASWSDGTPARQLFPKVDGNF